MTGHPRMVAYGHKFLVDAFAANPGVQWEIFSYMWSTESDNKREFKLTHADDQAILDGLSYSATAVQQDITSDFISGVDARLLGNNMINIRGGQVFGMIEALELWHDRLIEYDFIIRARWDLKLDPMVIKILAEGLKRPMYRDPLIYLTKDVSVLNGRIEISANSIYADRAAWIRDFYPRGQVLERMKEFFELNADRSEEWTAHELWGYLIHSTGVASITSVGEELLIRSALREAKPPHLAIREDVLDII